MTRLDEVAAQGTRVLSNVGIKKGIIMKKAIIASVLLTSLIASAETYIFDVQFSSDEKDIVSVEIDPTGKSVKEFDGELTSDFGEKIGTGTFLEVSKFSVENDDEVSLKFLARKRLFSHWQTLSDGRKNPLFKAVKLDTELKVKCNSWQALLTPPGTDPIRARVRKTK